MQIRTSIKYIFGTVTLFISLFFVVSYSLAATGTITTGYQQSTLIDIDSNNDGFDDVINWKPTNGTAVSITDSAITGYIWGESVGWINLSPATSGVTNTTSGVLGGYAWGENTGWINFAPTNGGVTISTTTGEFSGHAWSQNYGWIKFECPGSDTAADADAYADTCVKTNWTPTSTTTTTSGGFVGFLLGTPPTPDPIPTPDPSPSPDQSPNLDPIPDPTPDQSPNLDPTSDPSPTSDQDLIPDQSPTSDLSPGFGSGNGSSIWQAVNDIFNGTDTYDSFIKTFSPINDFFELKGETAVKVISTAGLATMAFSIPFGFWRTLLALFGYRKRHPWGTVYDSVTKAPLDPAHVVLMDSTGNIVATSLTDMDGRYGFSVNPGTYTLIANKTDYVFPSVRLAGRTFDEVYSDLYFGGQIVVTQKNEVILKSIPLDPVNSGLSWNEQEKKAKNMTQFFSAHSLLLARISLGLFFVGFIVSLFAFLGAMTLINGIVMGVYVILFIARQIVVHIAPEGGVVNKVTGEPLAFAVISIKRPETGQVIAKKVVDASGHYYAIVSNGEYTVSIEQKNADGTYTVVHTEPVVIKHGLLSKVFEV